MAMAWNKSASRRLAEHMIEAACDHAGNAEEIRRAAASIAEMSPEFLQGFAAGAASGRWARQRLEPHDEKRWAEEKRQRQAEAELTEPATGDGG